MSPELEDQIKRMHAEDGPNYDMKGDMIFQRYLYAICAGDKGDLTVRSKEEMSSVLEMIETGEINIDKEARFPCSSKVAASVSDS